MTGELALRVDLDNFQREMYKARAKNFEDESANARKREDTAEAGRFDSLAQQENMIARTIGSFTYPLTGIASSDEIDEQVTAKLNERGFVSGDEHKSERETLRGHGRRTA